MASFYHSTDKHLDFFVNKIWQRFDKSDLDFVIFFAFYFVISGHLDAVAFNSVRQWGLVAKLCRVVLSHHFGNPALGEVFDATGRRVKEWGRGQQAFAELIAAFRQVLQGAGRLRAREGRLRPPVRPRARLLSLPSRLTRQKRMRRLDICVFLGRVHTNANSLRLSEADWGCLGLG